MSGAEGLVERLRARTMPHPYEPVDAAEWVSDPLCVEAADALTTAEAHIEVLQAKLDADRGCACGYDRPDDICSVHSPKLAAAEARNRELEAALKPFAEVAKADISDAESDEDVHRPMRTYNRAPNITVGDLRRARRTLRGE